MIEAKLLIVSVRRWLVVVAGPPIFVREITKEMRQNG